MNVKGPTPRLPTTAHARPAVPHRDAAAAAALHSVLTNEERDFFRQMAALGPLTYGPRRGAAPPADAPRGARLDVRG